MSHTEDLIYEFGRYRFDPAAQVLSSESQTIALTPKASEILAILVAHAGELVEKDELLREVWPDTFVEESNLTQNIFLLRRTLSDGRSGPKYIETVTRRGYRFIAKVRVISPLSALAQAAKKTRLLERSVLAVLPFLNSTGDQELEYLADGVTDNIINNLSRVSKIHIMSQSAVSRYKIRNTHPQQVGKELGAHYVLIGKIASRPTGIGISVELVDTKAGWQLWGDSFDSESKDLLQIQSVITREVLASLRLSLTGDDEKHITARHTQNAEAYKSYLHGRYHWSRYTRKGIEKAILHFRNAIDLDPNYALAYAGIVDCYLRLATNYLPPEHETSRSSVSPDSANSSQISESNPRVKLRFEWDWKGAQRELRRANELKADYPSPHQWYVAFKTAQQLYSRTLRLEGRVVSGGMSQIPSVELTPTEEVEILCTIAREHIAVGNFDAAEMMLEPWYKKGHWPRLDVLKPHTAADLLFTLGTLMGWIASTRRLPSGQKEAEAFLGGSVALFEHLGAKTHSIESRMELARCYYRQGLFEIARDTISIAHSELPEDQIELRTICLVIWGAIERDSGHLGNSLNKLREAASLAVADPLIAGRCNHDLATTLKELGVSQRSEVHFDEAESHFREALYECEAVGHHRFAAAVENNMGFLLLNRGAYREAEKHLMRSSRLFNRLSDSVRGAQVNETLARLYLETKQYGLAREAIEQAVETFELTDGEALLAEALGTSGVVAARQGRHDAAKKNFEAAYKVAERCRDNEGAGRALILMIEELGNQIDAPEKVQIYGKLRTMFPHPLQSSLMDRVGKSIGKAVHRIEYDSKD